MDIWFHYHVTHLLHRYCNPISGEAVREMEHFLDLAPGARALDVACCMGEFLVGFAERWGRDNLGFVFWVFRVPS